MSVRISTRTTGGGLVSGDRLVIGRGDQTLTLDYTLALDQTRKGTFVSLAALQAAFPTASAGDWAIVDDSGSADATQYLWDDAGAAWINTGFTAIDIVDNLTTNDPSKALAASQGVAIATLIDAVRIRTDSLQYTFENSVNPLDVNSGEINLNNSSIAGTTKVTVSDDAISLGAFGEDWWASVGLGSRVLMYDTQEDTGFTDKYAIYDVTSSTHETSPDRTEIVVTFVAGSSGTFLSGDNINIKAISKATSNQSNLDSIDQDLGTADSPTFGGILTSKTTPAMQMFDTNASADEGFWETTAVNNKLRYRTRDDLGANGSIYFVVNRTASTVDTQQFLEGRVLVDDTTDATTTTDGSLQTDGGLSAVKSILTGSLFKSLIATGRAAVFGSSSLVDKYIQVRDGSGGLNLGFDDSESNVGIQAGTSKGFAVKVNSDATTFGLASPDFEIDTSGDATFYNAVRDFNRIGVIEEYAGTSLPTFALFADGSAVSRTTYSDLFARIGTVFGVGDGSTTFNLPDKRDRVAVGKNSSGTFNTLGGTGGSEDHLHSVNPPSTGSSTDGDHDHGGATAGDGATKNVQAGILGSVNTTGHVHTISSDGDHTHTTDIPAFNSDNGSSLQPYIVLNYIIWY